MSAEATVHDSHHDPDVAHHFESAEQQFESANLGMWIFLATEILFFGGLFCAYTVYRVNHPEVFIFAHAFLDKKLGALNTAILICSSFTMAWAVRAAQLRQIRILKLMLWLTILFAFGFLGVKYTEYSHKWHHGLLWARQYHPDAEILAEVEGAPAHGATAPTAQATSEPAPQSPAAATTGGNADVSKIPPAAIGPTGLAQPAEKTHVIVPEPKKAQIFFSIYFLMTGLHGVHVVLGIGAMLWLLMCASRGDFAGGHFTRVHMVGLYWHLVDLIWIYLFLLLYLVH